MLEAVVARLNGLGYRVAAVKHDAHRIELDTEGKDSWRLRQAGSSDTLLIGRNQILWMGAEEAHFDLRALIELFCPAADIVLVEGYRSAGLDTVWVQRPEVDDPEWREPATGQVITKAHPDDVDSVVELLLSRYSLGG